MQKLYVTEVFIIKLIKRINRVHFYGFVDLKSSNLYENLPVQTNMAVFSRRLSD